MNALQHGFYSRELTVSEADKRDFEILRESLRAQLEPSNALQEIGFEQIVTCCWRSKLAIRLEMHRLKEHFAPDHESTSNESAPQPDVRQTQWYGASRQGLREGIRFLQQLREDVSQHGPLHVERWKDQIVKAFGVGFYDNLTEWKDMNVDAIYAAEFLQTRAEKFKETLPAPPGPREGVKIIPDPKQKLQMLVKLIDLQAQHLSDLQQTNSEASHLRESAPNEFAPRYFATASRDLQRAVDWYLYLREHAL